KSDADRPAPRRRARRSRDRRPARGARVLPVAPEPLQLHRDGARLRAGPPPSGRSRAPPRAADGDARASGAAYQAPLHHAGREARGRGGGRRVRTGLRPARTSGRARLLALPARLRAGASGRVPALVRARAAFAEGVDTGTDAGLRFVAERAGLAWEEAS